MYFIFYKIKRLFLLLLLLGSLSAHAMDHNQSVNDETFSKGQKVLLANLLIGTTITVWGITQWEYFTEDLHKGDEGWFGKETSNGGADKLGHFFTNYLITRVLAPIYHDWGYSRNDAALYATATSAAMSFLMEVGDATSPSHGFSHEDMIMNLLGSTAGYFWYRYPSMAKKVDFRVEYWPDSSTEMKADFTTDYENMKHLIALKAEGFEVFDNSFMEYVELHFGYYTRNFHHDSTPIEDRQRYVYAGVGINLSRLTRDYIGDFSKIFNYYQVPKTYIHKDHEF